jgi:hypothetical protein
MQMTKVMLLGRTGLPQLRVQQMTSRRVTPQMPQNLFRAATLNGLGATRAILGKLAGPDEILDPWAANAQASGALDSMEHQETVQSTAVIPGQATSIGGRDYSTGYGAALRDVQDGTIRALKWWVPISLLSGMLSAYHGYKRDHTPIASFGWFTLGTMFPLITPAVAVAQGFGKSRRG